MASYELAVTPHAFSLFGSVALKPFSVPIVGAILTLRGGAITLGKNLGLVSTDLGTLNLDRLNRIESVVDDRNFPTQQYQLRWQRTMEAIERAYAALAGNVTDLSAVVDEIRAAQEAASAAQAAAEAASAAASQQAALQRTRDSYVDASPLTATNTGGVCSITVAAHDRRYLDPASSVSVGGGTIGSLAASTSYYVYYDDTNFAGGSVTYRVTTVPETAAASQAFPYRHSFPAITTPATNGEGSVGPEPLPPSWKNERDEQTL